MLVFVMACSSSSSTSAPTEPTPEPTPAPAPAPAVAPLALPDDHVVVEIVARGGMPRPPLPGEEPAPPGPALIASIRWDGQARWSQERRGGPPLRTGTVDVGRLRAWIDQLRRDGTFDDDTLNRSNFGPDAPYVQIRIDIGADTLRMASWHEVDDPTRVIATAGGLQPLGGRDPVEVMAAQPADYRRFIDTWTAIRSAVDGLLPARAD